MTQILEKPGEHKEIITDVKSFKKLIDRKELEKKETYFKCPTCGDITHKKHIHKEVDEIIKYYDPDEVRRAGKAKWVKYFIRLARDQCPDKKERKEIIKATTPIRGYCNEECAIVGEL